MKRRALLAAAGTAAVGLAGCLGRSSNDPANAVWSHDVGGRVVAATRGRVIFREEWGDDTAGDGSISALDADTGDHRWSYGSSRGYSTFSDPAVADAIYVGYGDDAVGSGSGTLYAIDLDGTERWTVEAGSVYDRPRLRDGTVYVGSDDGVVRAIDAGDGEVLWRHAPAADGSDGPPFPTVDAVDDDAVYAVDDRLLALDRASGDPLWRFGDEDASVSSAAVHDGVVFVRDGSAVRAVDASDGEALWGTDSTFESYPRVAVDEGRVFVRAGTALLRLDAADGETRWSADVDHLNDWTVHDDRVYAVGTELYAYAAEGGDEQWREPVADGPLARVVVAAGDGAGDADDHAAFVEARNEAIHRMTPGGEVTWSEEVPGNVRSYVVADRVYAGSSTGVYAFDPA